MYKSSTRSHEILSYVVTHRKIAGHTMKKMDKDSYYCDKNLIQSLVYDAAVTEGLDRHTMSTLKEDKQ